VSAALFASDGDDLPQAACAVKEVAPAPEISSSWHKFVLATNAKDSLVRGLTGLVIGRENLRQVIFHGPAESRKPIPFSAYICGRTSNHWTMALAPAAERSKLKWDKDPWTG